MQDQQPKRDFVNQQSQASTQDLKPSKTTSRQRINHHQSKYKQKKDEIFPKFKAMRLSSRPGEVKSIIEMLWDQTKKLHNNEYTVPQTKNQIIVKIGLLMKKMKPIRYKNLAVLSGQQYQRLKTQFQRLFKQNLLKKRQLQALRSTKKTLALENKFLKSHLCQVQRNDQLKQEKQPTPNFFKKVRKTEQVKTLQVLLADNQKISLKVSKGSRIKELKQYIYKEYSDFVPSQTVLQKEGQILNEQRPLNEIFAKENESLTQRKAQVWQIKQLLSDKNSIDQISCQRGVAFLKCGHPVSRTAMRQIVQFQVGKDKKHQVFCPYPANQNICSCPIEFDLCRLIAGYSAAQWKQISQMVSQNQGDNSAAECSSQYQLIQVKEASEFGKIKCISCSGLQFCAKCAEIIKGQSICRKFAIRGRLAEKNQAEQPKAKKTKGADKLNHLPIVKVCPRCNIKKPITIFQKVSTCQRCPGQYCFSCLKPQDEAKGCLCRQGQEQAKKYN